MQYGRHLESNPSILRFQGRLNQMKESDFSQLVIEIRSYAGLQTFDDGAQLVQERNSIGFGLVQGVYIAKNFTDTWQIRYIVLEILDEFIVVDLYQRIKGGKGAVVQQASESNVFEVLNAMRFDDLCYDFGVINGDNLLELDFVTDVITKIEPCLCEFLVVYG